MIRIQSREKFKRDLKIRVDYKETKRKKKSNYTLKTRRQDKSHKIKTISKVYR